MSDESSPALAGPAEQRRNAGGSIARLPLIIHAGLPKTATTYLQLQVFPRHPQIEYLGKCRPLFRVEDGGQEVDATIREVARGLASAEAAGRVPVISHEKILKGPYEEIERTIERIVGLTGQCRVFFSLRRPTDFVEAFYLQRMRSIHVDKGRCFGRRLRFQTFEQWLETEWADRDRSNLSYLTYPQTIQKFAARLGRGSVGVFLFESMRADAQAFLRAVAEFMNVDPTRMSSLSDGKRENVRMSEAPLKKLERLSRSPIGAIAFRFATRAGRRRMLGMDDAAGTRDQSAHVLWPPQWKQRIEDFTRAGNRELAQRWELPLAEHGYPL